MILVNNPGTWGEIYAPLRHAVWNGLTPTDLVFPFFMFMMGVAMYISLKKFCFRLDGTLLKKVFRRTTVVFLIFHHMLYDDMLCNLFGDGKFASLLYALFTVSVVWVAGFYLYRKKIYIKI